MRSPLTVIGKVEFAATVNKPAEAVKVATPDWKDEVCVNIVLPLNK